MKCFYILGVFVALFINDICGQCCGYGRNIPSNVTQGVYKTTGVAALDAKINTEVNFLSQVFRVNPNILIFNDGHSPNALAFNANTRPGSFGTIAFGISLLKDELWDLKRGELSVVGILAHEYAHILQYRLGYPLRVYQEIHADFLAGYYMGKRNYLTKTDIRPFALSLAKKGQFFSTKYGTPQQRVNAMVAGFRNSHLSLNSAYKLGISYVRNGFRLPGQGGTSYRKKRKVRVTCQHKVRCKHQAHPYDLAHPYDTDMYGNRYRCTHRMRCRHPLHPYDLLHPYDIVEK